MPQEPSQFHLRKIPAPTRIRNSSPPKTEKSASPLQARIHAKRPTFLYLVSMLLTCAVLVSLVAVYFLILLTICVATAYHLAFNYKYILASSGPKQFCVIAILYLVVGLAGFVISLFLAKPLFAKPATDLNEEAPLDQNKEEKLYAFVAEICSLLNAPVPQNIIIDLQVNAMARSRMRGFSFLRRRLELHLGLPLLRGLNTRQIAGVIAHEVGHFSQGMAVRVRFLNAHITNWFADIVYERDGWDEWVSSQKNEDGLSAVLGSLVGSIIWLTRRIMWLFFMIGHLVSSYMSRQMEFDADRYEALVAGSAITPQIFQRTLLLNIARYKTFHDLRDAWRDNRLPDDLVELTLLNVGKVPPDVIAEFEKEKKKEKTGWLWTHPSDEERITRATRLNAPGCYLSELPGDDLLSDGRALGRMLTRKLYAKQLGNIVKDEHIQMTESIVATRDLKDESFHAISRFFQGIYDNALLPLIIAEEKLGPSLPIHQLRDEILGARTALTSDQAPLRINLESYFKSFQGIANAQCVTSILKAKIAISDNSFSMVKPSRGAADILFRNSHIGQRESRETIEPLVALARRRFEVCLRALKNPDLSSRLPEEYCDISAAESLIAHLARVGFVLDLIVKLQADRATLTLLLSAYKDHHENQALHHQIREFLGICNRHLVTIQQPLALHSYPFAENLTMAQFALRAMPNPYDILAVSSACNTMVENVYDMYFRILGRLALIAEAVERALDMDPLPEPEQIKFAPFDPGLGS